MTAGHLQYFKKWDKLIDLEALATEFQKNPYWISRGVERELSGERCMNSLDIKSFRKNKMDETYDLILFRKSKLNAVDFSKSPFNVSDRVAVSIEIHDRTYQKIFSSSSQSLMTVETSVCSGAIVKISAQDICINLSQKPRRLIE